MNIAMAGIDYSLAGIDVREKFSLTKTGLEDAYAFFCADTSIRGAVVIATCNRTELYLSLQDGDGRDPFGLLCRALAVRPEEYRLLHRVRRGTEVFRHLSLLACGAKSQIWGEDQIITQVKNAIVSARECRAADGVLEVLFRTAVTAAKKIKTELVFSHAEGSVADQTVRILERQPARPARVLVIGNGEIGRLAASALMEHHFETWMTLRRYKHGQAVPVDGVLTMDYAERYEQMPLFDAVVSATLSPHFTVELSAFEQLAKKPRLMIDLAVPRDIDPAIGSLEGVQLFDVDTLAGDQIREDHARLLAQMEPILQKHQNDFQKWCQYKESVTA